MASAEVIITAEDKTQAAFDAIKKGFSRLNDAMTSTMGKISSLIGAAGFGAISKEVLSTADSIAKTSQKIGIGAEDLQKFQFAASQSGVETDKFNAAMKKFTVNIGEAATGNKTMIKTLAELGISAIDSTGKVKGNADVFRETVEAISKISDPTLRAKAAFDIFGKSGVDLVPLLAGGAAGLDEMGKKLEETGGIMSNSFIKNAEATNDAIDTATNSIKVGFTKALESLLPIIISSAEIIGKFAKIFGEFAKEHPTITKLAIAVGALAVAWSLLSAPLTTAAVAIGAITWPIGLALAAIVGITAAIDYFGITMLDIKQIATQVFNGLVSVIVTPISFVVSGIQKLLNSLPDFMTDQLPKGLKKGVDDAVKILGDLKDGTKVLISEPVDVAAKSVSSSMDQILIRTKTKSKTAMDEASKNFGTFKTIISDNLGESAATSVTKKMTKIGTEISNPIKSAIVEIEKSFDGAIVAMTTQDMSGLFSTAVDDATTLGGEIKGLKEASEKFILPTTENVDLLKDSLGIAATNASDLSTNLNSIGLGKTETNQSVADQDVLGSAGTSVVSGITGLNEGLTAFSAGAGPLAIAIAALTAILLKNEEFASLTNELNATLGEVLAPIITELVEIIRPFLPLIEALLPITEELARWIELFVNDSALPSLIKYFDELPEKLSAVWEVITKPFINFANQFEPIAEFFKGSSFIKFQEALDIAVEGLNTIKEILGALVYDVMLKILTEFQSLVKNFPTINDIVGRLDLLLGVFQDIADALNPAKDVGGRVPKSMNDGVSIIKQGVAGVWGRNLRLANEQSQPQINIYLDLEGQVQAPLSMFRTQINEMASRGVVAV